MSGLFGMSIGKNYQGNFNADMFWGTFYQQHLGESRCGVAIAGDSLEFENHRGYFRSVFSEALVWEKEKNPKAGIGYCGDAKEPFYSDTIVGEFCLAFTGNLTNHEFLKNFLRNSGKNFVRGDEAEVIAKLLSSTPSIKRNFEILTGWLEGAFSIMLLTKDSDLYVYSSGKWPLVVGEKGRSKGGIVFATGSAFHNLGFKVVEDVRGGELIHARGGQIKEKYEISSPGSICCFTWAYTAFPGDKVQGVVASSVREELGKRLARKDIAKGIIPDLVTPVPDSGRFHALGYYQEMVDQAKAGSISVSQIPHYVELLLKYPYAGRSFMPRQESIRNTEAMIKLVPSLEDYSGKDLVVVDDSIVRGTQTKSFLVPKLRSLGVNKILFRVGFPELKSYCPWGKTTKKGETLVSQVPSLKERKRFLGVDDLSYNSLEGLQKVLASFFPNTSLCIDCCYE